MPDGTAAPFPISPDPLVLFVSDIHFGHDDDARERAKEAALVACLRAHEPNVEHLYLLGDVFDEYIEYRYLVPKGYIRFQARNAIGYPLTVAPATTVPGPTPVN